MSRFAVFVFFIALAVALGTAARADPSKNPQPQWALLDRDLHRSIAYAAKRWHISYEWLHACAHDEGGHGRFVDNLPYIRTKVPRIYGDNYDGDGWWQYLGGTWTWMSNAAWKASRDRPPGRYRRIDSKLGQAYVTAWAFSRGHVGHWHGAAC